MPLAFVESGNIKFKTPPTPHTASWIETPTPEPIEKANGTLIIEAYTIIYDRKGLPEYGVVIGLLESGERTLAFISVDSGKLLSLEEQELIGKSFLVKYDSKINRNILLIES